MKYILAKFIKIVKSKQYEIYLCLCVTAIALISYNLGQINALKKTPITVSDSQVLSEADYLNINNNPNQNTFKTTNLNQNSNVKINNFKMNTKVVASKNSNKYHYSWCSGAKRIKPENQIWFNSAQEAESRGYTLAGNCQP
jgi:hypothetical protein